MRIALTIPPGLASDDTDFSTPAWIDGSNVRFWRARPQVIGGWTDHLSGSLLTGVCRNLYTWTNSNQLRQTAFGTHTRLQVYSGGALYNITPAGLVDGSQDSSSFGAGYGSGTYSTGTYSNPQLTYYARTWALDSYGDNLLAVPRGGTLYQWTGNTAAVATEITQAPDVIVHMLVTPERQVLALGCNEEASGLFNPLCIRGSDIENVTQWTTSSANNVFEHILEGGGAIVAGKLLGSYVAVWTDSAVYLGQFVGAPGQTYRFDRVADQCGLIGPNAVHVIGQTAYWIGTEGDFFSWSMGGVPQRIVCPIGLAFKTNNLSTQKEKIAAGGISQFGEVWWHYPDTRDGTENSRYIAVGTTEGAGWYRGVMARTAIQDAAVSPYPLMVTTAGIVYQHEDGTSAAGGVLAAEIESGDQYLEEGERRFMVKRFIPDFESQTGDVTLTINIRDWPQSAKTAKGPYTVAAGATKTDFRASGRIISMKFSSSATATAWRLGRPVFETAALGER